MYKTAVKYNGDLQKVTHRQHPKS